MSGQHVRFGQLDGLRGVAALVVVMSHYVLAFQPGFYLGAGPDAPVARALSQTPLILAFSPQFGVAVFFVLSGFVLAHVVTVAPAPLSELAVRRWVRLSGPVVATTLLVWLWLATGLHPDARLAAAIHSPWLASNYAWRAWQANDLRVALYQAVAGIYVGNNEHWWNSSLWTLKIELWGSLALFAAYAVMTRLSFAAGWRVVVAAGVAIANWRNDFGVIATGAALHECWRMRVGLPGPVAPLAGMLSLGAGMLLGGAPVFATHWTLYQPLLSTIAVADPDPVNALHRLGAILVVVATLSWAPWARLLTTRVFGFLGRVSFMVYLGHVPLLCGFGSWMVLRLAPRIGTGWACAASLPVFIGVLLALAALGTRWVDRPCIAWAHQAGRAVAMVPSGRGWLSRAGVASRPL